MTDFIFDRVPRYKAWDRDRKIMFDVHGLTFPERPAFLGAVFDGSDDIPWKGRLDVFESTGRKDMDGKEIFEGHILAVEVGDPEPLIGVVVYEKSSFIVKFPGVEHPTLKEKVMHSTLCFFPTRIIGTYPENPELIARAMAYGVGL